MIRAALIAVLCCASARAQDDWAAAVVKAHDHGRYAVRRAAANKIAQGGDAAVPALVAWQQEHGRERVGLEIVDAIARGPARGPAVAELLTSWAQDREFYWRSHALGGLARRASTDTRPLFEAALDDSSHLFRIEGARGLLALGEGERVHTLLDDPDPRVRARIGDMLVRCGDDAGWPALREALAHRDHEFLGDPWGARDAELAGKAFREFAASGAPDVDAEPAYRPEVGVEIRSCRNGDLFVALDGDTLRFGIDGRTAVVPEPAAALADGLTAAIPGDGVRGDVVCDFVRARASVEKHLKAAPDAVPAALLEWLNALAQDVDRAGSSALADEVRVRLTQFSGPSRK